MGQCLYFIQCKHLNFVEFVATGRFNFLKSNKHNSTMFSRPCKSEFNAMESSKMGGASPEWMARILLLALACCCHMEVKMLLTHQQAACVSLHSLGTVP